MIGTIIKEKRKAAGLTQAQVAELLGVTPPAVNRWEKNMCFPDVSLLAPLARLLNTDLNELFSFHDSLSETERELIVERIMKMIEENAEGKDLFAYIDDVMRENLSDGGLHLRVINILNVAHLKSKAADKKGYFDRIIAYAERAAELQPENAEDIACLLMGAYSEMGNLEKAEEALAGLTEAKYDKERLHYELLFGLEKYDKALGEVQNYILKHAVYLAEAVDFMRDIYFYLGDIEKARLAQEKSKELRNLLGLRKIFNNLSMLSSPLYDEDKLEEKILWEGGADEEHGLSDCPLLEPLSRDENDIGTVLRREEMLLSLLNLSKRIVKNRVPINETANEE